MPTRPREVPLPGSSTLDIDPPIALEPCDPLVLFNEYTRLQSGNDILAGLGSQLPAVEMSFYLRLEADVVHASRLYLIHPINMALQGLTETRITCQAEESHGPTARTDISWKYFDDEENEWRTLAILEFKNTYMLVQDDFAPGMADMRQGSPRSPRALISGAYSRRARQGFTWLREGASRLARQALKYSGSTGTGYVAIFDWKSMFIFDFEGMDEGEYELAKGTWFEKTPGGQSYETFRMLLFGMLVKALKRNGLVN